LLILKPAGAWRFTVHVLRNRGTGGLFFRNVGRYLARGSAPDTLRSQEPGAGRQKPETPPKDNENKILVWGPITV